MNATWKDIKATKTTTLTYCGRPAVIHITAEAELLNGNNHPHFSVTAEITVGRKRDPECCGCLHEEAAKYWPEIVPIIRLHLANADDGEPMHAEADGWYWLAGVLGGCGELYHGGNRETYGKPNDCLGIFADHCRISRDEAQAIADKVAAVPLNEKRVLWQSIMDSMKPRWNDEAKAGRELIAKLAAS